MLNFVQGNTLDELPGHQHIHSMLRETRRTFEGNIPLQSTPEAIGMFINSFNMLAMNYLGAGDCQAQILGLEPGCNAYRVWVKHTLIMIFLPILVELISPGTQDRSHKRRQ